MRAGRLHWRRAILGGLCGACLLVPAMGVGGAIPPAGAVEPGPHFYLALGGSDAVGLQPTAARPHGARTDEGYANDLLTTERSRWSDLELVQLGCPGETTATMLDGGDRCRYASGSQLAAAVSFLAQHPSTVLMTVDLGFNDVVHCLAHQAVSDSCVSLALQDVRVQLPRILTALRTAGGPALRIVGVGHYDPYLSSYLHGPAGQSFASESLGVMARLNDALRAAYAAAGIPMANVAAAFDMSDTDLTSQPGSDRLPRNVERACALTWMCAVANKHPNALGYRAISEAISDVLAGPAPRPSRTT